jgi:hypothetical protein
MTATTPTTTPSHCEASVNGHQCRKRPTCTILKLIRYWKAKPIAGKHLGDYVFAPVFGERELLSERREVFACCADHAARVTGKHSETQRIDAPEYLWSMRTEYTTTEDYCNG